MIWIWDVNLDFYQEKIECFFNGINDFCFNCEHASLIVEY